MSNGTVAVRLMARHNMGNYEHVEASVEITQALPDGEDPAVVVEKLQRRIAPLIAAKHVTGLIASAPEQAPVSAPAPEPEPVSAPALDADDMLTPAGKLVAASAAVDPLDEPAPPPKKRAGRPKKEAPVAGDPLNEAAAPAKSGGGQTLFQRILTWAGQEIENAAVLNRTLTAVGYKRLIDVPPEQLGDLAVALGLDQ